MGKAPVLAGAGWEGEIKPGSAGEMDGRSDGDTETPLVSGDD
jgi:hypothetical protein